MSKLIFKVDEISLCACRTPTSEEILEYLNEPDQDKRINLAYDYQISKEDLYEDDYQEILDDVYGSIEN